MSCQKHKELLERWWNDQLPPGERADLAAQLADCEDCRRELEGSRELWDLMGYMPVPEPSGEMQLQFNAMLETYKASEEGRRASAGGWPGFWAVFASRPGISVAFSLLMLLAGAGIGWLLRPAGTASAGSRQDAAEKRVIRDTVYIAQAPPREVLPTKNIESGGREDNAVAAAGVGRRQSESRQLEALAAQVHEMRELMMLSLLQNPAASERIKAVSYTSEMRHADPNIASALLATLDNDPNVNVRLTTLEALTHYADDPAIREGLVQSILQQDSPLVQVALADVMLKLQEKRAISPFRKLLQQKDLNETVRTKIQQTIVRLT
ncbi:MAG TPA: HEAT repeat domain-containing protein [Puia sp.]|nr:HEAT repeat domain-containing protein [Puia sp.]